MSVNLTKPARPSVRPSVIPPVSRRFVVELRRAGAGHPLVIRPFRSA